MTLLKFRRQILTILWSQPVLVSHLGEGKKLSGQTDANVDKMTDNHEKCQMR